MRAVKAIIRPKKRCFYKAVQLGSSAGPMELLLALCAHVSSPISLVVLVVTDWLLVPLCPTCCFLAEMVESGQFVGWSEDLGASWQAAELSSQPRMDKFELESWP